MGSPSFNFGLNIGGHEVSAILSLEPVARWFQSLSDRNAEARAQDEDPSLRPCRSIRVKCPACAAPIFFLTAFVREGELLRACRCCRTEFQVEM